MESVDTGFKGYVGRVFRRFWAYFLTCIVVAIVVVTVNNMDRPGGGAEWLFAIPLTMIGCLAPYVVFRGCSGAMGWDSYLTAAICGSLTGPIALGIIGTGRGNRYAIYTIDVSVWLIALVGCLAGILCFWLEAKVGAREIDL